MTDGTPDTAGDAAQSEGGETSETALPDLDRNQPDRSGPNGTDPDPSFQLVEGTVTIDDVDTLLAELASITADTGAVVQAFDADRIVGERQLHRAVQLAARAITRDEAVARDPAVEVLLYAAGRRQIDQALTLGVSTGEARMVVVVADFGDVPGADQPTADLAMAVERVEALLESTDVLGEYDVDAVRAYYDVTDQELEVTAGDLTDVVLERMALLDVEK